MQQEDTGEGEDGEDVGGDHADCAAMWIAVVLREDGDSVRHGDAAHQRAGKNHFFAAAKEPNKERGQRRHEEEFADGDLCDGDGVTLDFDTVQAATDDEDGNGGCGISDEAHRTVDRRGQFPLECRKNHAEDKRRDQRFAQHVEEDTAKALAETAFFVVTVRFGDSEEERNKEYVFNQRVQREIDARVAADDTEQERVADEGTVGKSLADGADRRTAQVLPNQAGKNQADEEAEQRRRTVAEEVGGDEDFAQAFFREGAEYQGRQGDADDEAPQRGQPFEGESTGAGGGIAEGDNDKNRDE